jgi:hypothetical protein
MTPEFLKYVRYLSKQDRKTLSQKTLKVGEEFGELAKAALPFDNAYATTHRFVEREQILEEAVDTVLCALSVAYDLDFTDDEVDDMFSRKAEKWALLQSKEHEIKYPLPYEIHITVRLPSAGGMYFPHSNVEMFRDICKQLQCKPIILDLQSSNGTTAMTDVMTSSKHFGTNRTAYMYAQNLAASLAQCDLQVVRIKIETVPWHPAAPLQGQEMPPNCYFEAHIPITLHETELPKLREIIGEYKLNGFNLHASQNLFKRHPNGTAVLMITLREATVTYDIFKGMLDFVTNNLQPSWTVGNVHTEFSVYDTKVSHDNAWITAK